MGCFRRHDSQKTSTAFQKYLDEARSVFVDAGGKVLPHRIQDFRIRLAEMYGTSGVWRRWAGRLGLREEEGNITYDWGRCVWVKE
jgi:hypothetical protein